MKLINAKTHALYIDRFSAHANQAWCILGSNRSGISDFFNLVCRETRPISADSLSLPENPGIVSFKKQQTVYEAELEKENTDFMDRIDPGTPARAFLPDISDHHDLICAFSLTSSLDKGYRQLSSGQARKLLILAELLQGRSCLMIEAPYEGLDSQSRIELDQALAHLHEQQILMILFVHNRCDIPFWCTHVGIVKNGCLAHQGRRKTILAELEKTDPGDDADFQATAQAFFEARTSGPLSLVRKEILCLNHGFAGYNGQLLFKDLSFTLHTGDHTLVTGPNGCGKSTLLQVITGDHPACYQNDLRVFGIQRGTGESIWEIKKQMGIVSSDLHRNYHVPGSTLDCLLSGFFDSIGLYQVVTPQQEQSAKNWLAQIRLTDRANHPFRDLSFAQQRLLLIARALIKAPELLVLDEPTQGLDEQNRTAVLDFLETVAKNKLSTLLYVSHRIDEFRNFFIQHIRMAE